MDVEFYKRKTVDIRGLRDSYKFYKSSAGRNRINSRIYSKGCRDFNKIISDKIITESFEFRMPYRLGFLRIKSIKQKIVIKNGKLDMAKNPIDWEATWTYWREIYPGIDMETAKSYKNKPLIPHTNEQTNGQIFKWYWDKRISNVVNNSAYVFKAVKGGLTNDGYYYGKRGIPSWVRSDDRFNDYYK
jgi:hypothetical protein